MWNPVFIVATFGLATWPAGILDIPLASLTMGKVFTAIVSCIIVVSSFSLLDRKFGLGRFYFYVNLFFFIILLPVIYFALGSTTLSGEDVRIAMFITAVIAYFMNVIFQRTLAIPILKFIKRRFPIEEPEYPPIYSEGSSGSTSVNVIAKNEDAAETVALTLWIGESLAEVLSDEPLADDQLLIPNEDGDGFSLTATVEYDEELWHWMLSQGTELMVTGPEPVLKDIKAEIECLAKWYDISPATQDAA